MEERLAVAAGLEFRAVWGGKLRRTAGIGLWRNLVNISTTLLNLRDLLYIGVGVFQCLWILWRFHPDAIFNKVGPSGIPVGVAARILGVPMVLHEPDVIPGWGNRFLSRWAVVVATGFPIEQQRGLPLPKLRYTGTPVQATILKGKAAAGRKLAGFTGRRPVILTVGGSQGAVALNTALVQALPELLKTADVLHITGRLDAQRIETLTADIDPAHYRHLPFLDTPALADVYATADLIVARAGASTIAEVAAVGKPMVLVPNRQAAAHQIANATALEDAGAALVVHEDAAELIRAVSRGMSNQRVRNRLVAAAHQFYVPDASERLADVILNAGGHR